MLRYLHKRKVLISYSIIFCMEKFYTKEFILAFLYNELPFYQKRQFVLRLRKDPRLRRMFNDLKNASDNVKNLKTIVPSERLINYIKSYATQSLESKPAFNLRHN